MTLDEAIILLHETLGEPTDFRPTGADYVTLDPTSRGYQKLKSLLNSGQTACANFKNRRGSQVRFGSLLSTTSAKVRNINAPFDIDNLNPYLIYIRKEDLPNPLKTEISTSGRFENSYFLINGESYEADFDQFDPVTGRWLIFLDEKPEVDILDKTTVISKHSFHFLPQDHPWAIENFIEPTAIGYGVGNGNLVYILKVINKESGEEIEKSSIASSFVETNSEIGDPNKYLLLGKTIRFDTQPTDGTRFEIDYYRTPTNLNDGSETFELPEQFHYGIITWAAWQGLIRMHELETSVLFKNDWYSFMSSTKNDNDYKWERTSEGSSSIRSK